MVSQGMAAKDNSQNMPATWASVAAKQARPQPQLAPPSEEKEVAPLLPPFPAGFKFSDNHGNWENGYYMERNVILRYGDNFVDAFTQAECDSDCAITVATYTLFILFKDKNKLFVREWKRLDSLMELEDVVLDEAPYTRKRLFSLDKWRSTACTPDVWKEV